MAATEIKQAFDTAAAEALAERAGEPAWLTDTRREALARFDELPWPDPTMEEWRHSNIKEFSPDGMTAVPAVHAPAPTLDGIPDAVLAGMGEVGDRSGLSVQIDADAVHTTLSPELAERGVVFLPLAEAAERHEDLVRSVLGTAGASASEEKLAALANALFSGGTFLYVPRGVEIAAPIQAFRWITAGGIAVFPRTVIVAEEGSSVTYVDHFRGDEGIDGEGLCVPNVEIYARQSANVQYLTIQDWPQTIWHFHVQRSLIGRDATVRSLAGTLGGRTSRAVVESIMEGTGGSSEMLGVYFADREQHVSFWSLQDHRAPNTSSNLNFKGALKGRSQAVYRGLIRIHKGATGVQASQTNRNLLLSDFAKADPAPFLEIEESDVAGCTHGTSVGQPDADQLFYLQTRGIPPAEAEKLIVKAFFQEVLDRIRVPEVAALLEAAVEDELALED